MDQEQELLSEGLKLIEEAAYILEGISKQSRYYCYAIFGST